MRPRLTRWTIIAAALVGLATACTTAPTTAPTPPGAPSRDRGSTIGTEDEAATPDAASQNDQRTRRAKRSGYTVTVD